MMSGRFMKLRAGRYTLMVPDGHGPAGVHRGDDDIQLDHHGGSVSFEVSADERVYFWWRGPSEPAGLRIIGLPAQDDSQLLPAAKRPAAKRPAAKRPMTKRAAAGRRGSGSRRAKRPVTKRAAAGRSGSDSRAAKRLRDDGLGPSDRMSA